jgi:hypothetical protein
MLKYSFIFFCLLQFDNAFGQRDKSLPWVSGGIYKDSCFIKLKSTVTKMTGFEFDKHPLIWVREQVQSNLQKTDTTYDDTLNRKTVYYYSKQGRIIQIVTTSRDPTNKMEWTKVYDDSNNLIFWENLEQNRNTVMRIRRGYDDFSRLLFECAYLETPIARLKIFPIDKNLVRYDKSVCDCDF